MMDVGIKILACGYSIKAAVTNFFTCGSRDCCCPDMLIFEESFEGFTCNVSGFFTKRLKKS